MLILAFESSAKAASVALVRDGALVAQSIQCSGLTHSRTLLPMAEDLLKNTDTALADVDLLAVAHGPGSFTGVRIGVSAVKGLAFAGDKSAVGVSTLEAMAWNGVCRGEGSLIACAMDARRNQVYAALFRVENGKPRRLTEDAAIAVSELGEAIRDAGGEAFLVGDGAELCARLLAEADLSLSLAPENARHQCAWGVAMAAMDKPAAPGGELLPVYLRLSQAERERQSRMNG